ncbi:TPA: hypothetical protein ACJEU7_002374 [Acinetobacter baumannii]|uniref:hypothetical protein n=1 Tax=Acinetobacter baumannii TaxID=470 RepID=UPI0008DE5EEF|nr:hypothetical protein [Acinetobacter baumannii]MCX3034169.1 hypothetical protein [Acinetobacter baumannii]OIH12180.1 hypothetical protein A7M79_01445 [Acinetobacter baumannii]
MSDLQPSKEKLTADHLESSCMSLVDALEELGFDTELAQDSHFCHVLDMHVLMCVECGYWFNPSLTTENSKFEIVCEDCHLD